MCFFSSPNFPERSEIIGLNLFPPAVIKYWEIVDKYSFSELETCKNLNVVMLWGVGGGKIQSSSWLINGEEK